MIDLLDFTPLLIDMSGAIPTSMPAAMKSCISWRLESDSVNAVWTGLSADEAGLFQRADCGTVVVSKLQNTVSRETNCVVRLNGNIVHESLLIQNTGEQND